MATAEAPPPVIAVAVEEICSLDPFNWTAKLSYEGYAKTRESKSKYYSMLISYQLTISVRIQDPLPSLGSLTEESFRRILEDHPERFPYDESTARPIATAIQEYGTDLWKQLSLPSFIAELELDPEAPPAVVLDVYDHGPQSLFQRLHWETMEQAGAAIGWVAIVRRAILDGAESSEFHEDDNPDMNNNEVRAQPESIVDPEISADEGLAASMGKLGVHEQTTDQNIHAAQPI